MSKNVREAFKIHETQKKLKYESRIMNEESTFGNESNYSISCKSQLKRFRKLRRRDELH